jgi:hypothetical protein
MKHTFSVVLFIYISLSGFSQEQIINIGIGFPIFFKSDFAEGGQIHQLTRKRVHLFAEMPVSIGTQRKLSVHPGVGYFLFNEIEQSNPNALGGYFNKEVQHNAINIYSRMFYQIESKNIRVFSNTILVELSGLIFGRKLQVNHRGG